MPGRRTSRLLRWPLTVSTIVAAVAAGFTVADWQRNRGIEVLRSPTANRVDTGEVRALVRLAAGETITVADLAPALSFIREGNDCSDFRLITLLRAAYSFGDDWSAEVERSVREGVVGVRYWMTEPGTSPMVYWSENHQILFAAAEYLAGQRYPDVVFRDGRLGAAHASAARARARFWLEQRFRFGFSEWNTHYYLEDIAGLAALVDFARDRTLAREAAIVLDLLLLDIGSQSYRGTFITTSGRLYEKNAMSGDRGIRLVVQRAFFEPPSLREVAGLEVHFLMSRYVVPPVLRDIAADLEPVVVRASNGRDFDELAADASLSTEERRIMALWGMEAFTNPRAIEPSLDYIRSHSLLVNPHLAGFSRLNYRLLRSAGLLPLLSHALDLPTNGIALTRASTYTVRNADFSMYTTQSYRPGGYGNQQHVFGMTFGEGVTLFHTHPAVRPGDPMPNGNSPGYWTGTGTLPQSCQDGAVNLSVYLLPAHAGIGRSYVLDFTHLYAPLGRFSQVSLEGNRLFLQHGDALVAVTGGASLERVSDTEIIQRGRRTFWVTEGSSVRRESFEAFVQRVRAASVSFDGDTLSYRSDGRTHTASFAAGCAVDGTDIKPAAYLRHDSRYGRIPRDAREYTVALGAHSLHVDLARLIRDVR